MEQQADCSIKKCILEEGDFMPTIAYLFGIKIMMYSDDHNPPHIHAFYSGESAIYDIVNVTLIKGSIPSRQDCIVRSFIA